MLFSKNNESGKSSGDETNKSKDDSGKLKDDSSKSKDDNRKTKDDGRKYKNVSALKVFKWYSSFFKGNSLRIAGGITLTFLQSFAIVPIPLIIKRIIDKDLPNKDISGLIISGAAAFGLYFLTCLLAIGGRSLTLMSTKKVTEKLRSRLCEQLQQMSLSFYDKEKASELHAKVVIDTERIDVMSNALVVFGITSAIMFILATTFLAYLNFKLLLLCYLMLPLFFGLQRIMKPALKKSNQDFRDQMEGMSSDMNDLLFKIRLVKEFAREEFEQKRADVRFRNVTKSALSMTILGNIFNNSMEFLTNTTVVLVYIAGGIFMIKGGMTTGEIIAFTGMLGFLISPVNMLMQMTTIVYSGLASLIPVYNILTMNQSVEVNSNKIPLEKLGGKVEFKDVTFVYESNNKTALEKISFTAEPGETVAVVGSSGSGKTTLINLILGFYFPSDGKALIDGLDITTINLRKLRSRIGVVSQDNVLFNTSIRENLTYGKLDATELDIYNAAAKAHAMEFIEKLPEKFNAIVGDRGVRLSGGQKQRLAIARALLKNPEILIFDEATSALDSESERKIQKAIEELKINRTCFIIAHRLSTVMNADKILVLKNGRIVEIGNHQALLNRDGEYARLCRFQFKTKERSENEEEISNE